MRRLPKCSAYRSGVGHVVPVRQEDVGDAAQRLKLPHQRGHELGRIDQPVAGGVPDEVAVAAIRLRGVEAAVVDRLLDDQREVLHHRLRVVVAEAADRPGGAGQERLQRLPPVGAGDRLGLDEGRFGGLAEHRGGDLPARIAVDAGGVHEEIAGDVLRHSFPGVRHDRASLRSILPSGGSSGIMAETRVASTKTAGGGSHGSMRACQGRCDTGTCRGGSATTRTCRRSCGRRWSRPSEEAPGDRGFRGGDDEGRSPRPPDEEVRETRARATGARTRGSRGGEQDCRAHRGRRLLRRRQGPARAHPDEGA